MYAGEVVKVPIVAVNACDAPLKHQCVRDGVVEPQVVALRDRESRLISQPVYACDLNVLGEYHLAQSVSGCTQAEPALEDVGDLRDVRSAGDDPLAILHPAQDIL